MKEEIFIKYLWYGYEGIGYIDKEIHFNSKEECKNILNKIIENNSIIYEFIDDKNGVVEKIDFNIYLRQITELILDY